MAGDMFYDFSITVPAGTLKASPKEEELKLTHGVIHTVRIDFPPGPRGEVSIALLHREHQLYPNNPEGAFAADNTYINFDDFYEVRDGPYSLTARAWSPTADYTHTLHVQVGVIESKIALATLKLALGLEKLLKIVGIKV